MTNMPQLLIIILASLFLSGCQIYPTTTDSTNAEMSLINNNSNTVTMNPTSTPTPTTISTSSATGNYAVIKTTAGDIKVKLFVAQAPKTVANFIGLATGTKDWKDPKTGKTMSGTSLYNGTIFHRVIKDFMIQGGDPLGQGIGGPGYQFADEFDTTLNFDKPYLLAMANSGANTNGSQFFITVIPTPWLNQKHTIFGEVVEGQKIVDAIATTATGAQDKPVQDIKINQIEIKSE